MQSKQSQNIRVFIEKHPIKPPLSLNSPLELSRYAPRKLPEPEHVFRIGLPHSLAASRNLSVAGQRLEKTDQNTGRL